MILWLGVVVAMNVLAVAAILVSISDRGGRIRSAARRDDRNRTEQL